VLALLTGVQVKMAFRALTKGLAQVLKERSTLGTTGDSPGAGHVDRSRTERVVFPRRCRFFLLLLRVVTRILISVLPVLAIGQCYLRETHSLSAFAVLGTRCSFAKARQEARATT